jgi:hypothetical protein
VIRYDVVAQREPGHFSVPRRVPHQLEVGQDRPINLVIDGECLHWESTIELRSGAEVYSRFDKPGTHVREAIRPHQNLSAVASEVERA